MAFKRVNDFGWSKGDKLTPAQINQIDVNQSRALDGVQGGTYSLNNKISLGGTGGLEIAGSGNAAWLQLSPRIQVIHHPFVLATVVSNAGPAGNLPSAQIGASEVTASIGGMVVASGCVMSPAAATTQAQASYFVLELTSPPDAARLRDVVLYTKGVSGSYTTVLPKYTLVQWTPAQLVACSSEITDDHKAAGTSPNWTVAIRPQTITADSGIQITVDSTRCGVLVKNPFDAAAGASFRIYGVVASYDVTSLRF